MNKKNIILILVGILIISMRFNVTFGHINIDVTNDCVGFLLIIIGVLPMINRNSRFKKSGIVAIVGFIASVMAQGRWRTISTPTKTVKLLRST